MKPIGECSICSRLRDEEHAFTKAGQDMGSFPAAARRLLGARGTTEDGEPSRLWRCPECGTCYGYACEREWLVNGSEEAETLVRLPPAEVRDRYTGGEYAALMRQHEALLDSPDERTRRYAARACTAHHLAGRRLARVRALLAHADPVVAEACVQYLDHLAWEQDRGRRLLRLVPALAALARRRAGTAAHVAAHVLARLAEVRRSRS